MPTKLFMVLKELIDTCWDVNCASDCQGNVCCFELIDTCWDVNADFLDIFGVPDYELIDTCWDVNV